MKNSTELPTKKFDYILPKELIAKYPPPQRDAAKMLVLSRTNGSCEIRKFTDLIGYLRPNDCLVLNDTKVISARFIAVPPENQKAKTEFFLVEPFDEKMKKWTVLIKPAKNIFNYEQFIPLPPNNLPAIPSVIIKKISTSFPFVIEFISPDPFDMEKIMDCFGHTPLPPYLRRPDEISDKERYQTVYASQKGAVAAPTAGLHFTDEILAKFAKSGIETAKITLHVGIGTFLPVKSDIVSEHKMHSEFFNITGDAAAKINESKKKGGRIVAVGTTSIRALESSITPDGKIVPKSGKTDIFIYPPYKIKSADILLTNFHLPKSTLLMLVSAFAGRENILAAYRIAVKEKFRFYSYGDCTLII
jgi:S-adenosylmethionine:tRNA ribosyltransferase-isomerase